MMIYKKNNIIDKYTVVFPIKQSFYAETYRVIVPEGILGFLKLICHSKLRADQLDSRGRIKEVNLVKAVRHHNLCRFVDSGQIEKDGELYTYYVMDFVSSETVEERMRRVHFTVNDIKIMAKAVLNALKALHSNSRCILHNDVTAENVLYDLMGTMCDVKLIDFGSASYASDKLEIPDIESTNPFYMAPERLEGVCSVESDLYSVGVFIYRLLFGRVPWSVSIIDIPVSERVSVINDSRRKPLLLPNINISGLDEQLTNTIVKALQYQPENRFHSAQEFIEALEDKSIVRKQSTEILRGNITRGTRSQENSSPNILKGNGFADVAGMDLLKEQLQSDVIDLLNDQERANSLGLTIPNGLLFYGPPGCGKTFFAEKFAEELKCNYIYVKCSDVASPYIHGGQEKIAAIFQEAREKAPSIIFLDEIDALLKSRDKHNNVSEAGEVNEFLEQLNNCGKDKVLVIGATNKPKEIDEAALRAGRLELKYFIPLPDQPARSQLFKIELSKRSSSELIDYNKLSEMTIDYSCADIKLLIDTAARIVFRNKKDEISEEDVIAAMSSIKPSLSKAAIKVHLKIRDEFENPNANETRRSIGFRADSTNDEPK